MTGRATVGDGRYELVEVIGTGAFSTVHRALDTRLGVHVAVKVLAENHSLDPDLRERFIAEGRLLRRIGPPYVITVYDIGETEHDQPYLVLQWADRGDLAQRAGALRALGYHPTGRDVLGVAATVAAALEGVHASGVVHRDLSPGNLLLRSRRPHAATPGADGPLVGADEEVLLADLGLSKDLAAASGLTVGAGTSGFASPEQRAGGHGVDQRADLWAAGALVVWVLLGRPPDEAGRWAADLHDRGWPPALVAVLRRSLSPDPAERPATPSAWRDAVALALPPADGGSRPAESRRRRPGRRALLAIAAALVIGAAAAWAVMAAVGRSEGPSVQQLDDGLVRSSISQEGVELAIVGPTALRVGETATFTAEIVGPATGSWITTDGSLAAGSPLVLTPRSAGTATVRLVAVAPDGDLVEVRQDVEVGS